MSAVKKTSSKKKSSKKSTARPRVQRQTAQPVTNRTVSELFTTRPQEDSTLNVPANQVALYVNGNDKGLVDTTGRTLGEFVVSKAQGINSFAVYADGKKLNTSNSNIPVSDFKKIEIVAKDARGTKKDKTADPGTPSGKNNLVNQGCNSKDGCSGVVHKDTGARATEPEIKKAGGEDKIPTVSEDQIGASPDPDPSDAVDNPLDQEIQEELEGDDDSDLDLGDDDDDDDDDL